MKHLLLLLRLDEPLELLTAVRRRLTVTNFLIALSIILAFAAFVAYGSDVFMEAMLVFGNMGLAGPILLGICGFAALMAALSYLLQDASALVVTTKELIEYIKRRWWPVKAKAKAETVVEETTISEEAESAQLLPQTAESQLEASKATAPSDKPTWRQTILRLMAAFGGGVIALGSALLWSITAFFGVVAIAQVFGGSMFSAPVLVFALLAAIAQGSASLTQEGWNAISKLLGFCGVKFKKLVKNFIRQKFQRFFAKKELSNPPTTQDKAADETTDIDPLVTKEKPSAGWRAYLPTAQQFVKGFGIFFALVAMMANSADAFMEGSLAFGLLGMTPETTSLVIVCGVVAIAMAFTFFYQEGFSLIESYHKVIKWFSFRTTPTPVISSTEPKPASRIKIALLAIARIGIPAVVAGFNAITAFFGVITVGIALGGAASAHWLVFLAVLAAIAQGLASASQEGRGFFLQLAWNKAKQVEEEAPSIPEMETQTAALPNAQPHCTTPEKPPAIIEGESFMTPGPICGPIVSPIAAQSNLGGRVSGGALAQLSVVTNHTRTTQLPPIGKPAITPTHWERVEAPTPATLTQTPAIEGLTQTPAISVGR